MNREENDNNSEEEKGEKSKYSVNTEDALLPLIGDNPKVEDSIVMKHGFVDKSNTQVDRSKTQVINFEIDWYVLTIKSTSFKIRQETESLLFS